MSSNTPKVSVRCGSCGKGYSLKFELAGKIAKCECGTRFRIPTPAKTEGANTTGQQFLKPSNKPKNIHSASRTAGNTANDKPAEDDFDDLELMPPVEIDANHNPYASPATVTEPRPEKPQKDSTSSWALKFVGVYGFVIMAVAAFIAVCNILFVLFLVSRPSVTLSGGLFLMFICAIQSLIWYVIFRLGQGLVNSERSSVDGLLVIFLLAMVISGIITFYQPSTSGFISLGIWTILFLPPIAIAYCHLSDFYVDSD